MVGRFLLEPTESQEHSHDFDVNVVIDWGSAEISVNGAQKILNRGESVFVERNTSHKARNLSTEQHCIVNCERISSQK